MVMSDKEFCEKIHMLIHLVRLDSEFKANSFDRQVGLLIIDKYKDTCAECKQRGEDLKLAKANKPEGFFSKINKALDKN